MPRRCSLLPLLCVAGVGLPATSQSPGCGLAPPYDPATTPGSVEVEISVPGQHSRVFLLHLPAGDPAEGGVLYDPNTPHPVVLSFHGLGMGMRSQQAWTGASTHANRCAPPAHQRTQHIPGASGSS